MQAEKAPLASVIVPVFEQWDLIPILLDCLGRQTFPVDDFDIVLVDNGSKAFVPPSSLPPHVRILSCPAPGSYAARNAGANATAGMYLAFTDADCRPDAEWLAGLVAEARKAPTETLLAGGVRMQSTSPVPSAAEIYECVKGIPQQQYVARGYAATANLLVSRSLFQRLGGFDNARLSGGDADFCRRAGAIGVPVRFVDGAEVGHPARATLGDLVAKARRVKGGQIAHGTLGRRLMWLARTLAPPVIEWSRLLRAKDQPLRRRIIAAGVQALLWFTDAGEAARLIAGGRPLRR